MPTLQELARSQQTTAVSDVAVQNVNTGGGANIREQQILDKGAALAKDIGMGAGKVVKEVQNASAYAGKRSGIDNLLEFSKDLEALDADYATRENVTSADYLNKSLAEEAIFKYYLERGSFGDNQIANQEFKDTYGVQATKILFASKTANAKKQQILIKKETDASMKETIEGVPINSKIADTLRAQARSVGNDPESVNVQIATNRINSLYSEYNDNNLLFTTEAKGGDVFNRHYGEFLRMDENGKITKVDSGLSDEQETRMIKEYNSLIKAVKEGSKSYNDTIVETVEKWNVNKMSSKQMIDSLTTLLQQREDLQKFHPDADFERVNNSITKANEMLNVRTYLETAVLPELMRSGIKGYNTIRNTSHSIYIQEAPLGQGIRKTALKRDISREEIDSFIATQISDSYYNAIQSDEATASKFGKFAGELSLTALNREAFKEYDNNLKNGNTNGFIDATSLEEFQAKFAMAAAYSQSSGKINVGSITDENLQLVNAQINRLKQEQKDGKPITDDYILQRAKTSLYSFVNRVKDVKVPDVVRQLQKEEPDEWVDSMVEGYVPGVTHFGAGSMNAFYQVVGRNFNQILSTDDLKSFGKSHLIELDSNIVPWAEGVTIMKPFTTADTNDKATFTVDNKKINKNIETLIQLDMGEKFKDISNKDNVKIAQTIDSDGSLITAVSIYSNGKPIYQRVMSAKEIASGIPDYKIKRK